MSEHGSNAIDPVVAKRWVGEIDRAFEELESEKGSYMARCKAIRERIKEYKENAANAGIPRSGLNHLLKRRELQSKLDELESDAEPEVVETADMIDEALGGDKGLAGTALGAAAGGTDADEPDLRGAAQKTREAQRKADAEANLAGMKADTAKKAAASRGRKSAALDDLAGREAEGSA